MNRLLFVTVTLAANLVFVLPLVMFFLMHT